MYVITARLAPILAGPAPPDIDLLRSWLTAWRGHVDVGHAYVRGDVSGVSLVLYLSGADLSQAENGARALLDEALAGNANLLGWVVTHCAADFISAAMDTLFEAESTDQDEGL
ncbi:hypothetical protein GCM10022226_68390 [Sphaerisporangium flaviroseum]|uniref:Uncharacterized protein n=1 Tax=Sphaerisporangium flaviroseum TaxID=509199 RepID=A0ABP7J8Z6_9ACTN